MKQDFIREYFELMEREGRSQSTIDSHTYSLKRFLKFLDDANPYHVGKGGSIRLHQANKTYTPNLNPGVLEQLQAVTEWDSKDYMNHLKSKYKPGVINKSLFHIKSLYDYLIENNVVVSNPFQFQKPVQESQNTVKWLHKKDMNALLREVRKENNLKELAIFVTLLNTGLRANELVNVKVNDISLTERKGNVHVQTGKNSKQRDVSLNKYTRQVLKEYMEKYQPGEYLFPSQRSPQMTVRALQHLAKKYSKKLDFDFTIHQLRHSCAKALVDAGRPLNQVAEVLGHSHADGRPNLDMVLVYTQPSKEDLEDTMESISII